MRDIYFILKNNKSNHRQGERQGKDQHGVGRSELSESGATFLDLLDVDEYCVSGGRGNVGHVQHNQTLGVLLKLMKV